MVLIEDMQMIINISFSCTKSKSHWKSKGQELHISENAK